MPRKLHLLALFLMAGILAVGVGCGGSDSDDDDGSDAASSDEPVVIGAAVGMTGVNAVYDTQNMAAAEMAVDDINEDGGILGREAELNIVDTHSDRDQSGPAAQRTIQNDAEFVITQCDYDFGSPAALVAQENEIVAMSCAMSPKFGVQNIGPYAYTINYSTTSEGATAAQFAHEELGARSVYILEDTEIAYSQDVCTSFTEAWSELAGEESIVGHDTFQNPDPSVSAQISRLRSQDEQPDFVMVCSYLPGGASVVRQLRRAGFEQPIYGSQAMHDRETLGSIRNLNDYYWGDYASIYGDDPADEINDFFARFEEETGDPATNAYPLTGYSMPQVFDIAAEDAGTTDGDGVRQALDEFEDVDLLIGPTTFTPELHIDSSREWAVMQIQNGEASHVTELTPEFVPEETF